MATRLPPYSPGKTSLSPPDAIAPLPIFLSPTEIVAEAGSVSIVLETSPSVVNNAAFCGSAVGYALVNKGTLAETIDRQPKRLT